VSAASSRPIVVFGDDWGRHVSSMQHVFRPILARRRVVWVNAIGHRVPALTPTDARRGIQKARAMLQPRSRAAASPWDPGRPHALIQPRVLPWHHLAAVHAFNTWSLVRAIRRTLAAHGWTEPPVLVTGSPPSVGVVGRLGECAAVYFCMDDFLHLPGVSAWMLEPLERRLLECVDAVVATAESLTRSKAPRNGRAHYLPQGVNDEHFATPQPEPADLAAIPRPRIGFAGGVSACCDFGMIRRIAQTYPSASVVLVGPVTAPLDGMDLPNIHVLGPRPYGVLPAYVQAFDVGLIPYVLNDWTMAVDPLKLLEYLAAGLPVVTTAIPEVLKYGDAVHVAEDLEGFVRLVGAALGEDRAASRERGRAVARRNAWTARADQLLAILDDVADRRGAPSPLVAA